VIVLQNQALNRSSVIEEQVFYDHFLTLVEKENPEQLIQRFRTLFLDGVGYPDFQITQALNHLLLSRNVAKEFPYILNRCLHILINRWQLSDRHSNWIPKLIDLFADRPINRGGSVHRSRTLVRLHQLVADFVEGEQYVTLRRLAQVIERSTVSPDDLGSQPLEILMPRYPYLYDHCLLGDISDYDHQRTIQHLKREKQDKFERDLSGYVTYHMRRNALMRRGAKDPSELDRILGTVSNPTLLTGSEVATAIKFYAGKVQGNESHRDIAQRFATHSQSVRNFGQFKKELYVYVTNCVDSNYGKRRFNQQFSTYLIDFLPDHDQAPLTEFLIVRTCSQVLNYLVVESPRRVEHFTFIDLLGNIGPMLTTGVLLRVVLFCKKVKPYLEKRLAILFNHYGKSSNNTVLWLVKSLENVNLALATNFGSVNLPFS
jgi:hypothetical protein